MLDAAPITKAPRPLLTGGERLAREAQPARGPAEKYHPQSLQDVRRRLGPVARDIRQRAQAMPQRLRGDRVVVEATLLPNYLAASYHPSELVRIRLVPSEMVRSFVGCRGRRIL